MSEHPTDDKVYWLDQKKNVDLIIYGLLVVCAGVTVADLFYHKHGHYHFEEWFGFSSWYGFVSCVFLVLAATQMRRFIKRPEDYYDDGEGDDA